MNSTEGTNRMWSGAVGGSPGVYNQTTYSDGHIHTAPTRLQKYMPNMRSSQLTETALQQQQQLHCPCRPARHPRHRHMAARAVEFRANDRGREGKEGRLPNLTLPVACVVRPYLVLYVVCGTPYDSYVVAVGLCNSGLYDPDWQLAAAVAWHAVVWLGPARQGSPGRPSA